jgi:hypothetical protein
VFKDFCVSEKILNTNMFNTCTIFVVFKGIKINLVKFNFVEKGGGQPGKGGSRRRVPVAFLLTLATTY